MGELLHLRFVLFGLAWGGLVYLQFFLAHREWRRLKGEQSVDIDLEFVRIEDCLPKSFRAKARDWMALPSLPEEAVTDRIIPKGQEQIRLTGPLSLGPSHGTADILIVEGDFECGPGCRMSREIWAHGNADIGAESDAQALAVDGKLALGEGVRVTRWADSDQEMTVSPQCRIGSRATSRKAVRLGLGAQALAVYAPEITTARWDGLMDGPAASKAAELMEIGPPGGPPLAIDALQAAGIEPSKLVELGSQCWSYLGEFRPTVPIRLRTRLVVRGRCDLPAGSVLEGDIKAHGALLVGHAGVCDGNLVSLGDVMLGRGCRFSGLIYAGGSMLLGSGTRGLRKKAMVAAYSSEDLNVEQNVAVAGKLASGKRVVVIGPTEAEEWSLRRLEGRT